MRWTPLRVEIETRTPVALGNRWLHFDGIIAHLCAREQLGEKYYNLPSKTPINLQLDIPLKKTEKDGIGIYHASAMVADISNMGTQKIYKRFEERFVSDINTKKKKINIASGKFRSYMIRLPIVPAGRFVFYACGDKKRIEEILSFLPGLGKKTVVGMGEIKDVAVSEIDVDVSIINNGVAMRPIPVVFLEHADNVINSTYTPPYWDLRKITKCAMPGTRVEVKKEWTKKLCSC